MTTTSRRTKIDTTGAGQFCLAGSFHFLEPRMAVKPDILVIGSSNMDMVVFCDRLPNPGEGEADFVFL